MRLQLLGIMACHCAFTAADLLSFLPGFIPPVFWPLKPFWRGVRRDRFGALGVRVKRPRRTHTKPSEPLGFPYAAGVCVQGLPNRRTVPGDGRDKHLAFGLRSCDVCYGTHYDSSIVIALETLYVDVRYICRNPRSTADGTLYCSFVSLYNSSA
jgi:hypothetical protein